MIVAGHQPNYIPYIGFFHKAAHCDTFVLVDTVQYVKRGPFGWINRNRIRTATGWIWLTVPVITKGRYLQPIKDTEIDNSTDWGRKHWASIRRNYQPALYFKQHADFFSELYHRKWAYLIELNEVIIHYLMSQLNIKANILKASSLHTTGKATDLIIDICKTLNVDTYLHGKHGHDYVDEDKMKQHDIKSIYQEFKHPVYQQCYQPFIPEMGVIDLLFNCGPESGKIISAI